MYGFLKSLHQRMNSNTKIIKIFLKQSKRKQRKYKTLTKFLKCAGDVEKTWNFMKDIIGKSKIKSTNLPHKLTINKGYVYNESKVADTLNDFFTNIGQKLVIQIPKSSKIFETYINKVNVIMESKPYQ